MGDNTSTSQSFYMDLFSNSSREFYPHNSMSSFKTQLIHPITLAGKYEVGLSEIIFPNNLDIISHGKIILCTYPRNKKQKLLNMLETEEIIFTNEYSGKLIFPKPSEWRNIEESREEENVEGVIPDPESDKFSSKFKYAFVFNLPTNNSFKDGLAFVKYLNSVLHGAVDGKTERENSFVEVVKESFQESELKEFQYPFSIQYSSEKGLEFFLRDTNFTVTFEASVARILGFPINDSEWLRFDAPGTYRFPQYFPDLEASKPRFFNIYTDIILPGYMGDTLASNLRTVPIPLKNNQSMNEVVSYSFNPPHYQPISLSSFSVIQILLRDGAGQPIRFQYGLVYLRLHFRPLH